MNVNPFIRQFSRQEISIDISSLRREVVTITRLAIRNREIPYRYTEKTSANITMENHRNCSWDSLAARECGTRLVLREITSRHGRDVLGADDRRRRACRATQHSRSRVGRSVSSHRIGDSTLERGLQSGTHDPVRAGSGSILRMPDGAPLESQVYTPAG